MRLLDGHLRFSAKSVGAALVALVGVAAADDLVSPRLAAALAAAVIPVLSALVPTRECTTAGSVTQGTSSPTDSDEKP